MTLAVAVLTRRLEPPFPITGVVLAADTRYSFPDGAGRRTRPPWDYGMKLAQIGPYAGAVCAGSAVGARNALRELRTIFGQVPLFSNSTAEIHNAIGTCLAGVDRQTPGYHMMLAYSMNDGTPVLDVVGSEDQLEKQPGKLGVFVMGDRTHQHHFVRRLVQTARAVPPSDDPEYQAGVVALALQKCIDDGVSEWIGGFLQLGLVTPEWGFEYKDAAVRRSWSDGSEYWIMATPPVSFEVTQREPRERGRLRAIRQRSSTGRTN